MRQAKRRASALLKPRRPEARPPKPRRPRSRRPGSGRTVITGVGAALITLILVAVLVIGAGVLAYQRPGPVARQGAATTVVLRKGAGVNEIASALKRAGVVRSNLSFIAAAQLTGGSRRLRAGEYAFPSRSSLAAVLARIRSGRIVHHRITVPEGLTSQQVVGILKQSPVLVGSVPTPPEGAILPETYEVVRGEQRAAVLQRMMNARDRLLIQLWTRRRPGLPYTNIGQAVTLASIVERETAVPAERPRVAAVYLNRLAQGMRLDADPTVAYGVDGRGPLGRPLSRADLQTDTPYNTYLHAGLPPGPIGNPGRASLAAVMDPPSTDELYFVADGSGGHVFARTLEEHNRNVAKWRQLSQAKQDAAQLADAAAQTATGQIASVRPPPPAEHR